VQGSLVAVVSLVFPIVPIEPEDKMMICGLTGILLNNLLMGFITTGIQKLRSQ